MATGAKEADLTRQAKQALSQLDLLKRKNRESP
jgi:hypothetical protein